MTIGCEGLPISQFNFGEVLNEWRQKKNRRILSKAVTSEENPGFKMNNNKSTTTSLIYL